MNVRQLGDQSRQAAQSVDKLAEEAKEAAIGVTSLGRNIFKTSAEAKRFGGVFQSTEGRLREANGEFTQTREAIDRLGDEAWESAREVDLLGDKLARTGRGHTDFTCSTEGASRGSHIFTRALGSQTPSKEVLSHVSVQTSQRTSTYFLNKLRDTHPEKRHRRIESHNISKLCEKYPRKCTAPSDFYFGDIDCVFSPFKDAEIDLMVLRVESEVAQEDFDKKQKDRQSQKPITSQSPAYQSPLVRRPDDEDDNW